jgi:dipeptide/tripeptide permease
MSTPTTPRDDRWPSQVRFILGNEAAERFSYYGMKAILALYITNVLMQTRDQATHVIHLFGFVNYFMPLVGAWISDRLWGRYRTILWISLLYCAGHGVLALSDAVSTIDGKILCLYIGLGLIAFGSGGIKPCVSAFMGDQFKPEQKHLLQKAYAAFYWCINLGSTASFLIIPWIRKEYGYSWAFGVPGIAMAIATLIFWLGTRHYVRVEPVGDRLWLWKILWSSISIILVVATEMGCRMAGWPWWIRCLCDGAVVLSLVALVTYFYHRHLRSLPERTHGAFLGILWYALTKRSKGAATGGLWEKAKDKFLDSAVADARTVLPILAIFALVPAFWMLFDQTFSTWVLQGEKMRPYFVSSPLLRADHVKDPHIFVASLSTNQNGLAPFLRTHLTPQKIAAFTNGATVKTLQQQSIAFALNEHLNLPGYFESNRFVNVKLSPETELLIRHGAATNETLRLNRLLIEDSFPDSIAKTYRIGPEEMLSANPILVMIFLPIMTLMIYPALGRFATPLRRMSAGMFLSGFSFIIVAMFQKRLDAGEQLSVLLQTLPYIIITIAEVLISTTGLEFAFREAAPSMKSTIMGFWQLTVAIGNLLVSALTWMLSKAGGAGDSVSVDRFMLYAGMTFVVAVLFSIIAAFYKYRDESAARGQ